MRIGYIRQLFFGMFGNNKGFSLPAVLFIIVLVTATIALVGTLVIDALKIQYHYKFFKGTQRVAEAAALTLMDYVKNNGNLPVVCTDQYGNPCTLDCSASEDCQCVIDWNASAELSTLKTSAEASTDVRGTLEGYLLRNCTSGDSQIGLVEIKVYNRLRTTSYVYFAYNNTNGTITFPLYFAY